MSARYEFSRREILKYYLTSIPQVRDHLSHPYIISGKIIGLVSVTKFRRLRWSAQVAGMEEGRSAFKILTGELTGKRPIGRPRHRMGGQYRS